MSPDDVDTWGGWLPPVRAGDTAADDADDDQIGALEEMAATAEEPPVDDATGGSEEEPVPEEPVEAEEPVEGEAEELPEDSAAQAPGEAVEESKEGAPGVQIDEVVEQNADAPEASDTLACPACGEHCPDEARFCLRCGTPLFDEVAEGVAGVAAAIVCEVTPPGDAGGSLERVRVVLERHGAAVGPLPSSPETLVAVFPPDELGGEDTLRAVRAAAEARDALRGRGASVRAGVGTCDVVGRDPEAAELSSERAVDLAVRLQRMAAPDEVIVGEGVYRLVADEVTVEPVDTGARLDDDGPIGPLRLLGVASGAATAELGETEFVGREAERAQLREAFERAVSERTGVVLDVVGEPGIGKTRLVEEFAGGLEGAAVLRVRCRSANEGGATWPLAELVERSAGLDRREPGGETRSRIERVLGDDEDADLVVQRLAAVLGLPDALGVPEETPWAVRRLLEAGARERPLVVWLDDADRTDGGFRRLLDDIAGALRDAPVLFVRSSAGEPSGAAATIRLEPLLEEEIDALASSLLANADPRDLAPVTHGCGGNPFVLEQTLAMLIEQGRLSSERGRWSAAVDLRSSTPPDVESLLESRLQALPLDERAVVGLAAVVGEDFPWAPMSELLPEDARPAVRDDLSSLVDKHILRPGEPDDSGEETFAFRHPLLRAAALATVPGEARAEVHERFARWLEESAAERAPRYAELIGTHLESAHRLRAGRVDAAGDSGALARRASDLLRSAAERAVDLGDPRGASLLFGRAASLLAPDDPARPGLLLEQALAAADAGVLRDAEHAAAEAVRIGRTLDRVVEWRAKVFRAGLRIRTGEYFGALENARATADQAVERFTELGDDVGLASAWALHGLVHRSRGYSSAFAEIAERVAQHARRAGRRREEVAALRDLAGAIADGPTPISEAMQRCERIAERVKGDRIAELDVLGVLALLRARRGVAGDAQELMGRALAAADGLGSDPELATCLHRDGLMEAMAGDLEAAEATLRRSLDAARRARDQRIRSEVAASLAHLVCERERPQEALELADEAEHAAPSDDAVAQVGWRGARARALAMLRRFDGVDALARQAVRLAEQTDSTELRAGALLDLAEVLRQTGRPNEAAPFVRRALRLYERRGVTVKATKARGLLEQLEPRS